LRRQASGAPRQQITRDGTDGPPGDQPEPHLVGRPRVGPHQQAVTGERLGIGVVRRRGQLL
jgi:hypothetical protein